MGFAADQQVFLNIFVAAGECRAGSVTKQWERPLRQPREENAREHAPARRGQSKHLSRENPDPPLTFSLQRHSDVIF
jgi:hypothetical protein